MERIALVESFRDTCRRFSEDDALRQATLAMQAGTRLYLPGFDAVMPVEKSDGMNIAVVQDTTFHCARGLLGEGRVAALNFANAYTPGGGVTHGAMAQEECLCRSSNLYQGLTLPYLMKNYYTYNAKNTGELGTDAVIHLPGVTVIKDDDVLPAPLAEPFTVDVLTCAAPCIKPERKMAVPLEALEDAFKHRIRNILEVAIATGTDCLVLGAFGCGAFNNPPELVAGCFRHYLAQRQYARFFKRVVFAIKGHARNANYEVFARILTGKA